MTIYMATTSVQRIANQDKSLMVFDWDKAARRIKEKNTKCASAGLSEDWCHTGGCIWDDGIVPEEDTYVYLASTWATPELDLGEECNEACFIMEKDVPNDWGKDFPKIYWPKSARKIIGE